MKLATFMFTISVLAVLIGIIVIWNDGFTTKITLATIANTANAVTFWMRFQYERRMI